jgi:hypothetical protein
MPNVFWKITLVVITIGAERGCAAIQALYSSPNRRKFDSQLILAIPLSLQNPKFLVGDDAKVV